MMCRCNALAMALESLGRSRSAGMVLVETLGLWMRSSIADYQTSDRACEKAGAQYGSRPTREGGNPPAAPITCPEPFRSARPRSASSSSARTRARAGQGSQVSTLPPPPTRAPALSYPPSLRFLRGLLRTLAAASYPATGFNSSGVRAVDLAGWAGRKSGSEGNGCHYASLWPSTPRAAPCPSPVVRYSASLVPRRVPNWAGRGSPRGA